MWDLIVLVTELLVIVFLFTFQINLKELLQ